MKNQINLYVPFQKSDDEKRMVYGYCTSEALDSQGEVVKRSAIEKAWADYMEYANVREMHGPSAAGVVKEYSHDTEGTFIGVKVVDDNAWKKVKEGVYKGFSIGGRVTKKKANLIEGIILSEISLVDRPANPDAKFTSYKMDGALVDRLALEAINHNENMKKFVTIDGVKYQEDPNKAGEALLDATTGEKVLFVEEAAPTETAEEKAAREAKELGDKNEAAGLNRDGSAKEVTPPAPAAAAPAAAPAAPAAEAGKAAATETKKDTMGVITLAGALDHLDFIRSMFEMNGKDVAGIASIIDECKAMISKEAQDADKSDKNGDLAKVMGAQLEKAFAPFVEKFASLEKTVKDEVASIKADVDTIKSTRVSPRPTGAAVPVEKTIENNTSKGEKDVVAKRKAVEEIQREVDEFADVMKSELAADPSKADIFQKKSTALFGKLQNAKRDLTAAGHN